MTNLLFVNAPWYQQSLILAKKEANIKKILHHRFSLSALEDFFYFFDKLPGAQACPGGNIELVIGGESNPVSLPVNQGKDFFQRITCLRMEGQDDISPTVIKAGNQKPS